MTIEPKTRERASLTRERVLRAAVELADRSSIHSLSMRVLGQDLGVEAMSLYHHVRNKEDLLDGMVESVLGEVVVHQATNWKDSLRSTILDARSVLKRHPWMPAVVQSRRGPGPAALRYLETVIGILRQGGFSIALAHHAMHVLGSRVLGFTQELFDHATGKLDPEMTALIAQQLGASYPHLTEMALAISHEGGLGGCDDDEEFEFALDLILDGLERQL